VAIDDATTPNELIRGKGHVPGLRAREGGVLVRAGHTEASVDISRLAGLYPAAVICEIMNDDGTMARRPQLEDFARTHQLKIGSIADLIRYRLRNERSVERIAEQSVDTEHGTFRLYAYEDHVNHDVHLALVHGSLAEPATPLVRVHLVDTLRDVLGVRDASDAWTLRAALARIASAPCGVVVILRQSESPRELADAVRVSARPEDAAERTRAHTGNVLRTVGVGAQILQDLGVRRMQVLSAPKHVHGLAAFGLEIVGYIGNAR
jgi:3,4-dihydroxy 2-butanone 4-phosphate synthase/GTP cyclohydrolase II